MENGRYDHMKLEELIQDEFFVESVLRPTAASNQFWQDWILSNPHQKALWEEAQLWVTTLQFNTELPRTGSQARIWKQIEAQTRQKEVPVVPMGRNRWIWAAAIAAGILAVGIWTGRSWWKPITEVHTPFAELKTVELPDHSKVTLNANSTMHYASKWKTGQVREVWLKGEGFFEVKHLHRSGSPIEQGDRFIVHAGGLDIEVLGTSFNVQDRKGKTEVVLESGKVLVSVNTASKPGIEMRPGEKIRFDGLSSEVWKETTLLEKDLSWRKKEIYLNTTTVAEVVSIIENHYGYQVQVENKSLLERKISGTGFVSLAQEDTFLKLLEITLGIRIEKKEKTLKLLNP